MVDLCRPSSLPNNQSLGPANENNENNGGNSTFFSNVFVSDVVNEDVQFNSRLLLFPLPAVYSTSDSAPQRSFLFFIFNSIFVVFLQLPYPQLLEPERHEALTVAAANRAMEQSRLEEEKLRVQTKEKKDQSNIFTRLHFHLPLTMQVPMPRSK